MQGVPANAVRPLGRPASSRAKSGTLLASPDALRPRRVRLALAFDELPIAIYRQTVPRLRLPRRPSDSQPPHPAVRPKPEEQAAVAGRQVAASPLGEADQLPGAHFQANRCADRILMPPADQLHPQPVRPV